MSQVSDAVDLSYPEKPDANGYAKRYFKRRAFYFGAHNTPESFLLFGEWKRQLIETGKAPEVKQIRKDMAHPISSSPHASLMPTAERRPIQYAAIASLAATVLFGWAIFERYFSSSIQAPTVDGITLTNEEIDFIRGIRSHRAQQNKAVGAQASDIIKLSEQLLEEGPDDAQKYIEKAAAGID